MSNAELIIKTYPKSFTGKIKYATDKKAMEIKGYKVWQEKEMKKFSGAKGCLLFILFPPLVFFGGRKYLEVTYQKV